MDKLNTSTMAYSANQNKNNVNQLSFYSALCGFIVTLSSFNNLQHIVNKQYFKSQRSLSKNILYCDLIYTYIFIKFDYDLSENSINQMASV